MTPMTPTILMTDDRPAKGHPEDRPEDHQNETPQAEDRLKGHQETRIHGFHAFPEGGLLCSEALPKGHRLIRHFHRLHLRTIKEPIANLDLTRESRSQTYLHGTAMVTPFWTGSINSTILPIEAAIYSSN